MCIRDRYQRRVHGRQINSIQSMSGSEYKPDEAVDLSVLVKVENIPQLWLHPLVIIREERQLSDYFSERAKVLEASVDYDPETDWSTERGNVRFQSIDEALKVIGEMSGKEMPKGASKPIKLAIPEEELKRLGLSQPPPKESSELTFKDVPKTLTENAINAVCVHYGRISSIAIHPNVGSANACTVAYSSPEEAANARANLHLIQEQLKTIEAEELMKASERQRAPFLAAQSKPYNERYLPSAPSRPPLQKVFIEYFANDGMPYYYNAQTKVTQWERPLPDCYIIYNQTLRQDARGTGSSMTGTPHARATNESRQPRCFHGGVTVCESFSVEGHQDATCSSSTCLTTGVLCAHL
eukprot:TRINITY_DN6086_c0_g4_i1.p1 TRINITY_DN6086_c0_g4~~TRINITY_DN6086_c0_g4_i1.p1  ORF type:complete len:354 (-),score=32.53 TRINITY_DN6086_c0_g4_i1:140-1201(-)